MSGRNIHLGWPSNQFKVVQEGKLLLLQRSGGK
jgi:hypothetical protein